MVPSGGRNSAAIPGEASGKDMLTERQAEMSQSEFHARLQRISQAHPETGPSHPAPKPGGAPRRTGWLVISLIWFVFVPLGIAMRVARQLYMELTSEAVHFGSLLAFVSLSHLGLIAVTVAAVFSYRSRPWLVWIAFFTWAGYGVGSALMSLKDMG